MRNILLGALLTIVEATIGFVAGYLVSSFDWFAASVQNWIYVGLTFVIFFVGARYAGRQIFWPALISFVIVAVLAIVLMSFTISEPIMALFKARISWLLLEMITVGAALWFGIESRNKMKLR